MNRNERKQAILRRVGEWGPALTAHQIAVSQHMRKSPHLIDLLEEMVNENKLIVQWARHENKTMCRYFSLPEQAPCLKLK